MKKILIFSIFLLPFFAFSHTHSLQLAKNDGNTLTERISLPPRFKRLNAEKGSFAWYLRTYPLKEAQSPVLLYNKKNSDNQDSHVAIFDLELENYDLQQSAQSVIRLYSDYLLKTEHEDKIAFHMTNGESCVWKEWLKKSQIKRKELSEAVDNLKIWTKYENAASKEKIYKSYLKNVFTGTNSLSIMEYESRQISMYEAKIGDILLDLGEDGHICLIVDVAANQETGEKAFLLAQGSKPAQDFHIIKNPKRINDPWYYEEDFLNRLQTPDHTFPKNSFRRLIYLQN
jgi:hypothetical protein